MQSAHPLLPCDRDADRIAKQGRHGAECRRTNAHTRFMVTPSRQDERERVTVRTTASPWSWLQSLPSFTSGGAQLRPALRLFALGYCDYYMTDEGKSCRHSHSFINSHPLNTCANDPKCFVMQFYRPRYAEPSAIPAAQSTSSQLASHILRISSRHFRSACRFILPMARHIVLDAAASRKVSESVFHKTA